MGRKIQNNPKMDTQLEAFKTDLDKDEDLIELNKRRPLGRPTKYQEEFCTLAIDFLSLGYSKEALAGYLHIAEDTLYDWIKNNPIFSEAVKEGVAQARLMWEQLGIKGSKGKVDNFNSVAWLFNMKNRFKWTDKIEMDHTSDGEKITGFVVVPAKAPEETKNESD